MLYDPKWEVKADPLSDIALIGWLERQSPKKEYCYTATGKCLLARYFSFAFGKRALLASSKFDLIENSRFVGGGPLPQNWDDIARGYPRTFGAALERARDLLTAR